jgi:hypothetical protein
MNLNISESENDFFKYKNLIEKYFVVDPSKEFLSEINFLNFYFDIPESFPLFKHEILEVCFKCSFIKTLDEIKHLYIQHQFSSQKITNEKDLYLLNSLIELQIRSKEIINENTYLLFTPKIMIGTMSTINNKLNNFDFLKMVVNDSEETPHDIFWIPK